MTIDEHRRTPIESGIRQKHRSRSRAIPDIGPVQRTHMNRKRSALTGSTLNIKERIPLIDEPVKQRHARHNGWREKLIFPKDIDVKR